MEIPTRKLIPSTIEYEKIPYFSARDKAYIQEDSRLEPFIKYPVDIDAFTKIFRDKMHDDTDRSLLASVLRKQYNEMNALNAEHEKKIDSLLDENTYTITTAHQPCLFTGPLYVIYKIISVINTAETIHNHYPEKKIVPVFIVGGEDHDFEEINHTYVFGNRIEWNNPHASGPVGRLTMETMDNALDELKELCKNDEEAMKWYDFMNRNYKESSTYGLATQKIIHTLFQDTDLLVLSMDDPDFKQAFSPIISKEILKQYSAPYVREAQANLVEAGFDEQAYVRDINFFYLHDNKRRRIENVKDNFSIVDSDLVFTTSEIVSEIENYPERFSPNVVMRPIYQEFILPNLAYIGGGGELAYWMERKMQFEAFDINFPMLIRRDSVLLIDKRTEKDLNKLNMDLTDLFYNVEVLIKNFAIKEGEGETSLSAYRKEINAIFAEIAEQAFSIDKSLRKYVKAEEADVQKIIGQIESKLLKAEKERLEIELNKIRKLKDRIFPGNSLQERHDNFLTWVIRYDEKFWNSLYENLDVFKKELKVISLV